MSEIGGARSDGAAGSGALAPGENTQPRKVGRPARLDRAMIGEAAHEVGLENVTMKAVADQLGVSIPGLYHHVSDVRDVMRLAAEHAAAQIPVPVDDGQHWTAWLLEWARYSHDAFLAQPELVTQFLRGAISVERIVTNVDYVCGVLERHGFARAEAMATYSLVSECAIGVAVDDIRERAAADAGRVLPPEYRRSLDVDHSICTLLIGIAVRRGEDWHPILDLASTRGGPFDRVIVR